MSERCGGRRSVLARALTCGGVLLALHGACDQAHAQPVVDEPPADAPSSTSSSEPLLEQAVALLEAGNQHDALLVLQRAALLEPTSVRVRVHLAAVHQALGEWVAAEQHLAFALAQREDPYVLEHEEALHEALSSIQGRLGELQVSGQPAGAEVLLDGRRLGTLPLEVPARILSGPHVLRVSLPGYRAFTASIDAVPGVSVNQVVHLEPEPRRVSPRRPPPSRALPSYEEQPVSDSQWLTWTLGGLSGAAAVTSAAAFLVREQHANRWNSVSCLEPGRTRAEVCAGERQQAEDWQRVMIGSGIVAGALLGGALISWTLESKRTEASTAISACGLGPNQLFCHGRF